MALECTSLLWRKTSVSGRKPPLAAAAVVCPGRLTMVGTGTAGLGSVWPGCPGTAPVELGLHLMEKEQDADLTLTIILVTMASPGASPEPHLTCSCAGARTTHVCTCIALYVAWELSSHPEKCFCKEKKIMSESSFSVMPSSLFTKRM